jgi:hypothetical protein
MKTYTIEKTETLPLLNISYDEYAQSPREDTNLGYFITVDSKYNSPDDNETLKTIIAETGYNAKNQADHMEMITKEIHTDTDEKVIYIFPITKYEHGNISYSLGSKQGFDNSNNGFYIITDETLKEVGTPKKLFKKVIEQELKEYNSYMNGEVYAFTLYDNDGNDIESCGGFTDIDYIKEHLPKEWQDENMNDYFSI